MIWVLLHEILCLTLFYGAFCRLVRVNPHTRRSVRVAFFLIGAAACAGIVQPLRAFWKPSGFELLLLLSIVAVQLATARNWRHGVPEKFLKKGLS